MAIHKSRNPALDIDIFKEFKKEELNLKPMSINGTVNKTVLLLLTVMTSAYFSWDFILNNFTFENFKSSILISGGIGLFVGLIIILDKPKAAKLGLLFCALEGFALGALSALTEKMFPGIVIQAISLTFAIFISLLIIYKLKLIKVDKNYQLIIGSLTSGVALYYFASYSFNSFGIILPYIHESSTGGMIFSCIVVLLAALNLVIDFDFVEKGVENGVPKYMEWYCAFGLMVTIIWLYLEVLNLLLKTRKK
jgi:uncharacterized YccA/Bax inhibitor family protein